MVAVTAMNLCRAHQVSDHTFDSLLSLLTVTQGTTLPVSTTASALLVPLVNINLKQANLREGFLYMRVVR
jgi:hypothetical protein